MEAEKRRYNNQTSYISGSTVRKLYVEPERDYDTYEQPNPRITNPERRQRPQVDPRPARQPRVGRGIDFLSLLLLSVAMAASLFVCFEFIKSLSESIQLGKQIVTLESQLNTLTDKNDIAEIAINQPIDLNQIYEVAVGTLGMVHPNNNTVIEYESNEVGYTRQYEEIPSVDSDFVLDKLQP
jgi:hypothetical protein